MRGSRKIFVLLASALALAACKTTSSHGPGAPPVQEPTSPVAPQTPAQPTENEQPHAQRPEQPEVAPDVRESFARGAAAFQAGNLDDAEDAFEDALEAQPDSAPALYDLGLVAERRGDLAQARKQYEAALEKDPRHVAALLNLGRLYRSSGELEAAVALYEKAAADPALESEGAILNNLVVVYRLAKKFDLAEAAARRALARSANSADAYKNLALVYYDEGRYELAELLGAQALKLQGNDPGIYNNLGLTALKLGDRARALALFKKAVEIDPSFAPGHRNIGAMALASRDYATAERELAKARELAPDSPDIQLAYAYALGGLSGRDPSRGAEAGKAFERVLALQAGRPEAICGAGWAYSADQGSLEKAIDFLGKCKALPGTSEKDARVLGSKIQNLLAQKQEASKAVAPAPADQGDGVAAPTSVDTAPAGSGGSGPNQGTTPPSDAQTGDTGAVKPGAGAVAPPPSTGKQPPP